MARQSGYTLLELACSTGILLVLLAAAVPQATGNLDEARARAAARHVAARLQWARVQAASRGAAVGFRFERSAGGYVFAAYVDGNRNGIRAVDITAGGDPPLAPAECLSTLFGGVDFGLAADVPPIGSSTPDGSVDPIRVGRTDILSIGPTGTATSGTLYVRAGRAQFAIRVLGATGRTRVWFFDRASRRWRSQ